MNPTKYKIQTSKEKNDKFGFNEKSNVKYNCKKDTYLGIQSNKWKHRRATATTHLKEHIGDLEEQCDKDAHHDPEDEGLSRRLQAPHRATDTMKRATEMSRH